MTFNLPPVETFKTLEPASTGQFFRGDLFEHPTFGAVVVVDVELDLDKRRIVTWRPALIEEMRDHGMI